MFCQIKIHIQVKYGMVFCITKKKSFDRLLHGNAVVIFCLSYHNGAHYVYATRERYMAIFNETYHGCGEHCAHMVIFNESYHENAAH